MNKRKLSILLVLVMLLSMTILPAAAQKYNEDEIINHFGTVENWVVGDLELAGVGEGDVAYTELTAKSEPVIDPADAEAAPSETPVDAAAVETPVAEEAAVEPAAEETSAEAETDLIQKSILLNTNPVPGEGTYVPCGDGKLQVKLTLVNNATVPANQVGEPSTVYIKSIKVSSIDADPTGGTYELTDCKTESGESCDKVTLDAEGKATLTGMIAVPQVYGVGEIAYTASIEYSKGEGAATEVPILITGKIVSGDLSMCPSDDLTVVASKGMYEQCGGKAKFSADLQVPESGMQFIVPAEIMIHPAESKTYAMYKDFSCRFTRFDENGYPISGDDCVAGQRIDIAPGEKVRLEAAIDALTNPIAETSGTDALEFKWRLGGSNYFLGGKLESTPGPAELCAARIVPLTPLAPTAGLEDPALPKSDLWWLSHENAVVGVYQKCGKFAVIQVRLRNDGAKPGYVTLPGAVSVNGGSPISYYWLSTIEPEGNRVLLEPGETVSLLGRLYLTNLTYQTNSDSPANVAVSFADLGLMMSGELTSDKVTTRCSNPE